MKRISLFGILPFIIGLVAAWLRANELVYVFDPITGLPSNSMWVTGSLVVLACAVASFFLVVALRRKCEPPTGKPSLGLIPSACASFCILFALSGYELYSYMQSRVVTDLIFGVLTLLCSVAQLFLGLKRLEARDNMAYNIFAAIPTFWTCYALILIFRQRISDPIISDYVYLLLAFVCILLFAYAQCGYIFGKNRAKVAIFTGALTVFFSTVELFAPIIAGMISSDAEFMRVSLQEAAPLAAFLIYIPFSLEEMLENNNRVGL